MDFSKVRSITIPEGDVRSIAVGGTVVWRKASPLPYDAEVEYLEATGTQYIDLGLVFSETDCLRIDTALLANVSGTYYLHGQNSAGNGRFAIGKGAGTWGDWYFGLGDKNLRTGVPLDTARHVLELDGAADTAKIDGTSYTIGHTLWSVTGDPVANASAFCRTSVTAGSRNGYWIGRVWGIQVRSGGASGTLVRNLVPVRKGWISTGTGAGGNVTVTLRSSLSELRAGTAASVPVTYSSGSVSYTGTASLLYHTDSETGYSVASADSGLDGTTIVLPLDGGSDTPDMVWILPGGAAPLLVANGDTAEAPIGYLYDKVSGQLLGNGGAGEFIVGADKTGGAA